MKVAGLILLYFVRLHEPRAYYIYTNNTLLFDTKAFLPNNVLEKLLIVKETLFFY